MADATVALASKAYPNGVDNTQRRQVIYGTMTITANAGTAPATGLPLDWSKITNGNGGGYLQPQVGPSVTQPDFVTLNPAGADVEQLYTFDSTDNSLVVWGAGAVLTTGIVAGVVDFKAEWIRGV